MTKKKSPTLPLRTTASPGDSLILLGALAVVAISPFFRGLFFPLEQLVALMVVAALVAIFWGTRRGAVVPVRLEPLDISALVLILAYVLSVFVAANLRNAVQEVLKLLLYFGVYWLLSRLATDRRRVSLVLHAVLFGGVAVALLGLGVASGVVSYRGAFDGGRIASSFQYANTNAAYLGTVLIVGLGLWQVSRRAWWRSLYAAAVYSLLITFVFTYSRGAWLVLPVAALGFLVALPAGLRGGAVARIVIVGAATAAVAGPMGRALQDPTAAVVLRTYVLGLLAVVVLNLVYDHLSDLRLAQLTWLRFLALGIVLLAMGGGAIVMVRHTPSTVMERLRSISLQEHSVQDRFAFYQDAWKIIKTHPILGTGGGGWAAVYQAYQSYAYYSTQAHNYFVQTLIEAGPLALTSALALWGTALWSALRVRPKLCNDDKVLLKSTTAAAAVLGLHSIIDFNLTLGAVSLLLWTLFGVARSFDQGSTAVAHGRPVKRSTLPLDVQIPKVAAVVTLVLTFVAAGTLLAGDVYGQSAAKAMNVGQSILAEKYFRQAVRLDPLTASYYVDLGQITEARARQGSDQRQLLEAGRLYRKGLKMDPHSPVLHPVYAQYLLRNGQIDLALAEFRKALTLAPYHPQQYENLARAYMAVGQYYIGLNQVAKADQYLSQVPGVAEAMRAQSARAPAFVRPSERIPAETPTMELYLGISYALRKQWANAERSLGVAWQGGQDPQAGVWLAAVYEMTGEKAKAQQYKAQALKARPALQSEYVNALAALRSREAGNQ